MSACGGARPAPDPAEVAARPGPTDLCRACASDQGLYCDMLGSSGAEGGVGRLTGGCAKLPRACRGEGARCDCFGDLKGCRCTRSTVGFEIECPAP